MEISISVKILIPEFLLSFINLITQLKPVSYVKLSNDKKNVHTLAQFGHTKVENLVQDKVFFKSRLLK
jgi:hypothetical protein